MTSLVNLDIHRTASAIIPLTPDDQIEIKNNIFLRGMEGSHAPWAMSYAVIEKRTKLKEEFRDLPQERLRELRSQGVEITRTFELPQVAYTGDTEFGPYLFRDEFANAKIVVSECTFFEAEHESRAKVGKHMHVEDLAKALSVWKADAVVLIHLSRRTNLVQARELLIETVGEEQAWRVHFLMDYRTNRQRYERQELEIAAGARLA